MHDHQPRSRFPIGFAHRGGTGPAPQNSIAAFRHALDAGVTGVESDTWLTADNVPVLDHDGLIGDRAVGMVERADLPDHVPTVAEFYDTVGTECDLSVDVLDTRAATPIVQIAAEHGCLDRLWLVAPWPAGRAWRAIDPDVHLVANVAPASLGPGFGKLLRAIRAAGACGINLPYWWWNPLQVRRVHSAGLLAFGWHAHDAWKVAWLRRIGVDGIYSDSITALVNAGLGRPAGRPSR